MILKAPPRKIAFPIRILIKSIKKVIREERGALPLRILINLIRKCIRKERGDPVLKRGEKVSKKKKKKTWGFQKVLF